MHQNRHVLRPSLFLHFCIQRRRKSLPHPLSSVDRERDALREATEATQSEGESELAEASEITARALQAAVRHRRGSDAASVDSSVSPNGTRRDNARTTAAQSSGGAVLSRKSSFFLNAVAGKHVAGSGQSGGSPPLDGGGQSANASPARVLSPVAMSGTARGESTKDAAGWWRSAGRRAIQLGRDAAAIVRLFALLLQLLALLRWAVYSAVDTVVASFLEDSSLALYYESASRSRRPSVETEGPGAPVTSVQRVSACPVAVVPAPRTPRKLEQAAAREARHGDTPVSALSAVQRLMARRDCEQRDSAHSVYSEPAAGPHFAGRVASSRPLRKAKTLERPTPRSPPPATRQETPDAVPGFDPRLI
jgi:hypothetical protein